MLHTISWHNTSRLWKIRIILWGLILGVGFSQFWACRHTISTEDGVAYLDVADAYLQHDWTTAINGYWSPLFSWILLAVGGFTRTAPHLDAVLINATNYMFLIAAMAAFDFLVHGIFPTRSRKSVTLMAAGYSVFAWAALCWITVQSNTPDMLVAALVFVATGLLLRFDRSQTGWTRAGLLGGVLGAAYLAKAVMFPLAGVFIAMLGLSRGTWRQRLYRGLTAGAIFIALSAPFITALSKAKGRVTFGETGRLNYVWYVNPGELRVPCTFWQGGPLGHGTPEHAPRLVLGDPPTFEFSRPLGGTYPPWTDPSYWYEGLRPRFNMERQWHVVTRNIRFFWRRFLGLLAWCYAGLWLVHRGKPRAVVRALMTQRPIVLLGVAGLLVYALGTDLEVLFFPAQPSTRMIAPFAVLIVLAALGSLQHLRGPVQTYVIAALVSAGIYATATTVLRYNIPSEGAQALEIAAAARATGLSPQSRVAIIGDSDGHTQWARTARIRIVAQTFADADFWGASSPDRHRRTLAVLEAQGCRAVIAAPHGTPPLETMQQLGWQALGKTGYYIRYIDRE